VGRAASRATTRANPHHLARPFFLLLDMAHLGESGRPEMRSIQAHSFVGCQKSKAR
jgi:hypothetical protein